MLGYAMAAHNATWQSDEGYLRAGSMAGGAILLSFSGECALKALLEKEGKLITRSLWTHDLYKLFIGLETKTRTKASNIYEAFVDAEGDVRVHKPPMDSLILCLKNHDDAFVNWRYNIGNAGKFYPVPMMYAAIALLTFVYPKKSFVLGCATSFETEVIGGKTKRVS